MNSVSGRPRILIENLVPSSSGIDVLRVTWSTVPDPSKLECRPASASSAKISRAGALMTRSTLTVFPCTGSLSDLQGHHAPAPLLDFDAAGDGPNALPAGIRREHLGGQWFVGPDRPRRRCAAALAAAPPPCRVRPSGSARRPCPVAGASASVGAERSACVDRSPPAPGAVPRRRTSPPPEAAQLRPPRDRRAATARRGDRCRAAGDGGARRQVGASTGARRPATSRAATPKRWWFVVDHRRGEGARFEGNLRCGQRTSPAIGYGCDGVCWRGTDTSMIPWFAGPNAPVMRTPQNRRLP